MKRRIAARTPTEVVSGSPAQQATPPSQLSATSGAEPSASTEKRWEIDGAEAAPAPHIRANMISFRVSYQGRIQVAFFDQE